MIQAKPCNELFSSKNDAFVLSPSLILIYKLFSRTDAEFSAMAKVRSLSDGTTAIVAVIHGGKIYVANGAESFQIKSQKIFM